MDTPSKGEPPSARQPSAPYGKIPGGEQLEKTRFIPLADPKGRINRHVRVARGLTLAALFGIDICALNHLVSREVAKTRIKDCPDVVRVIEDLSEVERNLMCASALVSACLKKAGICQK